MPDADAKVPSFHGNFRHGIDQSRRVMIPARWRPKNKDLVFTVILWPVGGEEFLLVLPPERAGGDAGAGDRRRFVSARPR